MGFGVVHGDGDPKLLEHGVVKTRSTEPMPERLLQLFNGLNQVIVDHAPDVMAVEQLFFARNVTNALAVGQARGVVLLAGAQHGIPVFEYKPSEVKLAVAGHGAADKQQVQSMVQLILSLDAIPHPDDAADALAVAICHVYSSRLGRIASRQ
ncbi:crossover junction endodeoxyribonuclease RuvC [soil metagenome]